MDNAVIVQVSNGRECGADKVGGVGFVIRAFTTYAIEELAAESKIGNQIDWLTLD